MKAPLTAGERRTPQRRLPGTILPGAILPGTSLPGSKPYMLRQQRPSKRIKLRRRSSPGGVAHGRPSSP